MDQQIFVNFVGRRPIDWSPATAPMGDIAATSLLTVDPRFVAVVQAELDYVEKDARLPAAERAEQKARLVAIHNLVLDPSAHTTGLTAASWPDLPADALRNFMTIYLRGLTDTIARQLKTWNSAKDTPGGRRDAADQRAQKTVSKWYGNHCVLTGTAKPQAAHIVPVRAKDADHAMTWKSLQAFWSLPEVETLALRGREQENVLPLTHTMRAFWDLFFFALRPVAHLQDPVHRLYLQLVWLKDPDGGRIEYDWQHARFGGGCDFRRARDGHKGECEPTFPTLQHGTVFELVTADPAACPLPSLHFLQIQYGIHRIMAGMQAASGLRTIFSDDPPPDTDGDATGIQDSQGLEVADVPPEWRSTLDAAIDAGVLDEQAAVRWGRAFTRAASDREAELERNLRWLQRMTRGEMEEEEEEDP